MAIYHLSAKIISRSSGANAVASAAYRSGSVLVAQAPVFGAVPVGGQAASVRYDFSRKSGVIYSEVLGPAGTPARLLDRETLWNEVERVEVRKDAQLAREVEFALPRELDRVEAVRLAREFVKDQFVAKGMVSDMNIHWDVGEDGEPKPHVHVMLALREVIPEAMVDGVTVEGGFGRKVREWNDRSVLTGWREAWAVAANRRLAELGIDARIDHRSHRELGLAIEPQGKIGPAAGRLEVRGEAVDQVERHREIARRNGALIIADANVALGALTRLTSTFTARDLEVFAFRHSDTGAQYDQVLAAVRGSPDLVLLGRDDRGRDRFSSREMVEVERRLEGHGAALAGRGSHAVSAARVEVLVARSVSLAADEAVLAASEGRAPQNGEGSRGLAGLVLSEGQRDALDHITRGGDLSLVVGFAGAGKSTVLGIAREVWEGAGYRVVGAALAGIAAEGLEGGSGISSRTLASWEYSWKEGRDRLSPQDVLVIDEAGLVGSRQLERVLGGVAAAGAKVVLVGDPEQLQSIEAGAAFRALIERHGAAEITEVRRQRLGWQQEATRELATGRTAAALVRYDGAGSIIAHETREAAKAALVAAWAEGRRSNPDARQLLLAHTRADVADLNLLARRQMKASGALGEDHPIETTRGVRAFAVGDQVVFLRNERSLGVKNGTLGAVITVGEGRLGVRLLSGELVRFDVKAYGDLDHGYASTLHKSQGATVDQSYVLASPGLDRHGAYVGLTRHREGVQVHYGRDDFKDFAAFQRVLGRERAKDTTLDYLDRFAEVRGLEVIGGGRSEAAEVRATEADKLAPKRNLFAGLKLAAASAPVKAVNPNSVALNQAIKTYAEAQGEILEARRVGRKLLPHELPHRDALYERLKEIDPLWARATAGAIGKAPDLVRGPLTGERQVALYKAILQEERFLADPNLRADKFVQQWQQLEAKRAATRGFEHSEVLREMIAFTTTLDKDPEMKRVASERYYGKSSEGAGAASSWPNEKELELDLAVELRRELNMALDKGLDRGMSL